MKTIAVVINTSWNIYNFRLGLLKALQENGYKVVAIAPEDDYSPKLEREGIKFFPITMSMGTNPFEDFKLTTEFYRLYKQAEPDVILHYTIKPNIYGTIAAKMLNIPSINNIAGLGTLFVKQGLVTVLAKKLYKYSQLHAKQIFFQNNDDLKLFSHENLVKKDQCDVLPGSGVNVTEFKPVEKKEDGVVRFLLIARMLWEKGIGDYVSAAQIIKEKYKNVEFQLLGFLDVDNPSAISKGQMQTWVDQGLVNYLGTTDNVKKYIGKADCIVLPSFYREGVPRTLLEAASMAKPIITTDSIGCKEVVDHGVNGFLCQPKNSESLAEQIQKIMALTPVERAEMGQKGREKIINEFDEKIVIGKYLDAIELIC